MTDFSFQTVSSCGGGSVAHMTDCKSHLQKYSVNSNREFPAAPSVISRLVVKPDKPTKCFTTRISLETFVSLIWTGDVTGLINSLHESEREMSGLAESAENPASSPGRALSTLLRAGGIIGQSPNTVTCSVTPLWSHMYQGYQIRGEKDLSILIIFNSLLHVLNDYISEKTLTSIRVSPSKKVFCLHRVFP